MQLLEALEGLPQGEQAKFLDITGQHPHSTKPASLASGWGKRGRTQLSIFLLLVVWGAPREKDPSASQHVWPRGWSAAGRGVSGVILSQHVFNILFLSPQQHRARLSWRTSSTARTFTRKPAPSLSSSARD